MSSYSVKELIEILEQHGWYEVRQVGSHKQFKHPNKPNKITVPITQVKKNIEMHILRQAGLKHLMKRRNTKPQPKKLLPVYVPVVTDEVPTPKEVKKDVEATWGATSEAVKQKQPYKTPAMGHDGYLHVIRDADEEAAKNTPCFTHTVNQLEKLGDKPKEIKENKEKTTMPTLGEISKVTITPPKPTIVMGSSDYILEYLSNPIRGFRTSGANICRSVIAEYHLASTLRSLNSTLCSLVKRGKVIRKKVGKGLYNFSLPNKNTKPVNDLTFVPKTQETASEPVARPTASEPVARPTAQPAMSVKQTDSGVTISITLNLNLKG